MNVLFTHAWPWLAALIAVPLLLHLFARTRPPAYLFPSVEFIQRVLRKTMRVKRPQDWLLLVLRTLLVAAFVLAFLRPVLLAGRADRSAGTRRNLVLVIDASASMACTEGAQTRFASACAEAAEVLAGLTARDRADIVWLQAVPVAVFPELGVNFGHLHTALRSARVTSEEGAVAPALRLAVELLRGAEGRREICVISDFQKTTWAGPAPAVPPEVTLSQVRIGQAEAANQAVTRLGAEPARPLRGEEATILCDVQNFSAQPQRRTVYLTVGETRASQDLVLPPWGRATAVFKHAFGAAGAVVVAAAIDEDLFGGDDRRWLQVPVADRLDVGLLDADPATAGAWRRVLDALGWARLQPLREADLERELACDAVLLAGWSGRGGAGVRRRAQDGALVLWSPARDTAAAAWAAWTGVAAAATNAPRWEVASTPFALRLADEGDPLFRLFKSGEYGDPARGRFLARLRLSPVPPSAGRVLLAYEDGVPALTRLAGGAAFYLWNLPLDPALGNWTKQDEFVLLCAELLLSGRGGKPADAAADQRPGQPLAWTPDQDIPLADVQLVAPEGGPPLPVADRRDNGVLRLIASAAPRPGVYTWQFRGQPQHASVVNFPESESDLRALSAAEIERSGTVTVTGGNRLRRLQEGIPLWPWLLAGALGLAVVELLAAWWTARTT